MLINRPFDLCPELGACRLAQCPFLRFFSRGHTFASTNDYSRPVDGLKRFVHAQTQEAAREARALRLDLTIRYLPTDTNESRI